MKTALALPLAAALAAGIVASSAPAHPEQAVALPAPAHDVAATARPQVAVLAGGCFWGMEAVFEHVRGVRAVTAGYAGGAKTTATYDQVSTETTGHAEAIRVVFDPHVVSFGTLLRVYFSIAHDPTELNRQGPDSGPSYRSAIFPQTPEQRAVAAAYIDQLRAAHGFGTRPIVTKLETAPFFPAEAYHQRFFDRHPDHPYIVTFDKPKVAAFRAAYPKLAA